MDHRIITKYFNKLPAGADAKFAMLGDLYVEWNAKINLISRKDIEFLFERHVLHSLAIAEFINFKDGTTILDIGTGGGFPGIPLAIMFPNVKFTLVDSIGKKIKVVEDMISRLNLTNATAICDRAENLQGTFDYIVSRATAPLNDLYKWSLPKINKVQKNAIPNGIICLKGGELDEEIKPFKGRTEVVLLSDYFAEEYFLNKKLIFVTI